MGSLTFTIRLFNICIIILCNHFLKTYIMLRQSKNFYQQLMIKLKKKRMLVVSVFCGPDCLLNILVHTTIYKEIRQKKAYLGRKAKL